MKLHELLLKEMPRRNNSEMEDSIADETVEPFYTTQRTLNERKYKVIAKRGNVEVILKDDLTTAMVGSRQKRHDGEDGVLIYGQLMFKDKLKIGADVKPLINKVLQVDIVEVARQNKFEGLGSFLYSSLVQDGYTIISDTLHYKGGYKLWKKLARSHLSNEAVYILDHGHLLMDGDKPIEYDGNNIPEDQIWSDGSDLKKFVLLVYTKKR